VFFKEIKIVAEISTIFLDLFSYYKHFLSASVWQNHNQKNEQAKIADFIGGK
jgi:hypothetical protein